MRKRAADRAFVPGRQEKNESGSASGQSSDVSSHFTGKEQLLGKSREKLWLP
jgi:hypothetical protein